MTKVESKPFVRATGRSGKLTFGACESSGCESAGGCDGCCSGTCGGGTCDSSGFSPISKQELRVRPKGRVYTRK